MTPPEPAPAAKLAELRDRLDKDPKSRMFVQLAEEYRRAGQLGEAIASLRRGLEHHPSYVAAWNLLGKLYVESGRDHDAKPVFERTLSMDPQNLVAARLLGDVHYRSGAMVEAIKRYKLVRAISPGDDALEERIASIEVALGERPAPPAPTPPPAPAAIEVASAPELVEAPASPSETPETPEETPSSPAASPAVIEQEPEKASSPSVEAAPPEAAPVAEAPIVEATSEPDSSPIPGFDDVPASEDSSPFDDSATPPAPTGITVPDPDSSDFWREAEAIAPPPPTVEAPAPALEPEPEPASPSDASDFPFDIEPPAEPPPPEPLPAMTESEPEPAVAAVAAVVSVPPAAPVAGEIPEGSLPVADYRLRQGDVSGARSSLEQLDTSSLPREVVADRWDQLARREAEIPTASPFVTAGAGAVTDREAVIRALRRWLDVIKKG